jgi:hypothetical protein
MWIGMAGLLTIFVGGTLYTGRHALRPVQRAIRVGWDYGYGFSGPEAAPDGGQRRWAAQRALTVLTPSAPWLKVTISVNHLDIDVRPVDAKLWCNGRLILESHLTDIAPRTAYVHVPAGVRHLILETWVSRVVHPYDFGVSDRRDLGLLVEWQFVSGAPDGRAVELNRPDDLVASRARSY